MAKRIRAIKCPQCGNTKVTETKADYYSCNSCKSEFFIDSDDIHIHHRHTYDTPHTPTLRKFLIPFIMVMVISTVFLMSSLWFTPTYSTVKTVKQDKSYWDIEKSIVMSDPNEEPVVLVVGQIVSGNYPDKVLEPSFGLFHAKTFQKIAIQPIDIKEVKKVFYIKFEEGKTYIVINENRLFLLDETSLNITEITPQQLGFSEFDKGFSKIENYNYYTNSLIIMNNLGQKFHYLPQINKVMPYPSYKELRKMISEHSSFEERDLFTFSKRISAYEDKLSDKLPELFKVKVKSKIGYPYSNPSFYWDYNIIKKIAELKINKEEAFIVSYENFTKGRYYFNPKVLYANEKELLIIFKHELAESSPYFFQILDAQTGEIKLTLEAGSELNLKYLSAKDVAKINEGYLISRNPRNTFIINKKENKIDLYNIERKLTVR